MKKIIFLFVVLYVIFSNDSFALESIVCDGEITFDANSDPLCLTGWLNIPAPTVFDISQIDTVTAGLLFGAGFSIFTIPWLASFGFTLLLKTISRRY